MTNTLELSYLDFFGLQFDPFSAEKGLIFSGAGGRTDQIEQAFHLLNYSELTFIVSGDKGIGKTSFITQMYRKSEESQLAALIELSVMSSLPKLVEQLGDDWQMNLDLSLPQDDLLAQIISFATNNPGQNYLLLVDNVDESAPEISHFLQELHILSLEYDHAIKMVLAGDNVKQLQTIVDERHYVLNLNALSKDDCAQYITDYFKAAGYRDKMPLSKKDLQAIFDISEGIPNRINRSLQEYMQKAVGQKSQSKPLPLMHIGAALVVLLVIGISFVWQFEQAKTSDDIVDIPVTLEKDSIAQRLEAATQSLDTPSAATVDSTFDNEDVQKDLDLSSSLASNEAIDNEFLLDLPEPAQESEITENTNEKLTNENVSTAVETPTLQASDAEEVNSLTETVEQNTGPLNNSLHRQLLEDQGYTLQIIGLSKEVNAKAFIKEQSEQDNFTYYQTQLNQKPWYIVVYGQFDNRAEAVSAIPRMESKIKSLKPWALPLKDLQAKVVE